MMMMNTLLRPLGFAAAAALMATPAWADKFEPYVTADFLFEVESDTTVAADDSDAELTDTFATVEAAISAYVSEAFSLHAGLTFEPVLDAEDDRFFEDHGLYVDQLYADLQVSDSLLLRGGKFGAAFGIAWDEAPGLFGTNFAEDYELAEQLGAAVEWTLPGGDGAPTLSVAAITADSSGLSDSIFQDRGQTSSDDGGAGNTGSLESVAASLDGEALGFGYSLGGRFLAAGEGDPEDEIGGSLGLTREFELSESQTLTLLGEGVYLANAGGATEDAIYFTGAAAWGISDFTLSGSYTLREIEDADATDHLATTSLEYEIAPGFGVGAGYAYTVEEDADSHTVGLIATYEFGVSSAPEVFD